MICSICNNNIFENQNIIFKDGKVIHSGCENSVSVSELKKIYPSLSERLIKRFKYPYDFDVFKNAKYMITYHEYYSDSDSCGGEMYYFDFFQTKKELIDFWADKQFNPNTDQKFVLEYIYVNKENICFEILLGISLDINEVDEPILQESTLF